MKNRFSAFVCNNYLPLFVSLYNSYKYYNHETPLNVYDYKSLNTFNVQYLKKFVEVTHVDHSNYEPFAVFLGSYAFKFASLIENMWENEIILDTDMNFLNNNDHVFSHLEQGKLLQAREGEGMFNMYLEAYYKDKEVEHQQLKDYLKKHIGDVADTIPLNFNFQNNNAGFMGFNREKHMELLKLCIRIIYDKSDLQDYYILNMEQTCMCFLSAVLDIEREILPQKNWMNTWNHHSTPQKEIFVDNGKLALKNADDNSRVNMYHYTGSIGVKNKLDTWLSTGRMYFLTNDYIESIVNNNEVHQEDIFNMWVKTHNNPIVLLYQYFYNNGDMKCPKYYNIDFRENVSRLLKVIYNEEHHKESNIVIMITLLYDYITLLDYKLVGENKYYKILDALNVNTNKDTNLTIGIDTQDAIVSLSETNNAQGQLLDWFHNSYYGYAKDKIVERFLGVFITTKGNEINL